MIKNKMENRYTNLELSKKLEEAGCELEASGIVWGDGHSTEHLKMSIYSHEYDKYPCFDILNDICCKYAKEFFGEESYWDDEIPDSDIYPAYIYHSKYILYLMQDGVNPEDYIWEHCLFNKKRYS